MNKKPVPLEEPQRLGDNQWMVPCVVDEMKFVPLVRPPKAEVPWTEEEDRMLATLVLDKGLQRWTAISNELNQTLHHDEATRHGNQCRERWFNHLEKTDWTEFSNKWSMISRNLPGHTENSVKNRWKSINRRSLVAPVVCKVECGGETGQGSGSHIEELPLSARPLRVPPRRPTYTPPVCSPESSIANSFQLCAEEGLGLFEDQERF